MLIVALVLAVIGLAALVTAVVTSNELVAWVCIAASVLGVILLIVDAIRERQGRVADGAVAPAPAKAPDEPEEPATADAVAYSDEEAADSTYSTFDADYPDESLEQEVAPRTTPRRWSPTIPSPTLRATTSPSSRSRPRRPRCTPSTRTSPRSTRTPPAAEEPDKR